MKRWLEAHGCSSTTPLLSSEGIQALYAALGPNSRQDAAADYAARQADDREDATRAVPSLADDREDATRAVPSLADDPEDATRAVPSLATIRDAFVERIHNVWRASGGIHAGESTRSGGGQ
jgi:hypothetical protein